MNKKIRVPSVNDVGEIVDTIFELSDFEYHTAEQADSMLDFISSLVEQRSKTKEKLSDDLDDLVAL